MGFMGHLVTVARDIKYTDVPHLRQQLEWQKEDCQKSQLPAKKGLFYYLIELGSGVCTFVAAVAMGIFLLLLWILHHHSQRQEA